MKSLANPSRRRLFSGKIRKENVLRLPWVISEEVFTEKCTQCQECISACETQIITKDKQGFPSIDFSLGECTFCMKCIQNCKEPLFLDTKNETKPWPAILDISDKCLAKNNIYCQSCRDECEPNAIKFSYLVNGETSVIPQPTINLDDCTQCGACIKTCPQDAIAFSFESNSTTSLKSEYDN
jgi:ferredoxin-type protein NapF